MARVQGGGLWRTGVGTNKKKESDESLTLLVLGRGIEPLLQD